MLPGLLLILVIGADAAVVPVTAPRFVDVTVAAGLGAEIIPETVPLVCFADVNGDGWADAVINGRRVFLNQADSTSPIGRRFVGVPPATSGLVAGDESTLVVFADLDNDGRLDAISAEYVDSNNEKWVDHGRRSGWQRGRGDGTFEARQPLPAPPRTTRSIAVGDVNRDGRLDLYIGNWYVRYGEQPGYPNDLLLSDSSGSWTRQPLTEDDFPSADDKDLGGRPTFGTMILTNPLGPGVMLLELNYGRRWDRAWTKNNTGEWYDIAPRVGLDGDEIRHGIYPDWMKERAKTDPRFKDLKDEPPWRSNGNTFDGAIGDIDNDGDFDLFISEIAHGWAGDSSDRTRVLFQDRDADGIPHFVTRPAFNVDRVPPPPPPKADGTPAPHTWNEGDLYCELADLDQDGRLDLIIASGDYPDDQRLRVYLQTPEGGVRDATKELGIDHECSAQIALSDVDGDGDIDILAGQTFNRYSEEKKAGRSPHPRLLVNQATGSNKSLTLRLEGDGKICARDALGAVVTARAGGLSMRHQLVGVGGRAGKQNEFLLHFGLGTATTVDELVVEWPDAERAVQTYSNVAAGRYSLRHNGRLVPIEE